MAYFQIGDSLDSDFSAQAEIDRFVFLDKQIYGMMSVFGNGVIEGWEVAQTDDFSISISPGYGNINFIACRTQFSYNIPNIGSTGIAYVYARVKRTSPISERPDFILLPTLTNDDPDLLVLAGITTDGNSITAINNDIRTNIGFLEIIRAAIRQHRHRGGSDHPSKIDLESEVQGQLPSFRLEDMDAEKVTSGIFDLERMPLINHDELLNVGILTHPQLDTFVKTLEASNKELFGEIGSANVMQFILALKFIFDDPNSAHYVESLFDQNMINQIAMIPGITPDSYIDFDASSADIDLVEHEIRGSTPTIGTSFYVTYDTDLAWNSAVYKEDVHVSNDQVTLKIDYSDTTNRLSIENFESASEPGENLSDGNPFVRTIVAKGNPAMISAESSATNVTQGFYAGEFTYKQDFRIGYTKQFSTPQDWSSYDSFVLQIKCLAQEHGPVKIYFTNSSGDNSAEYVILDTNEVTEGDTPESNAFDTRVIDIGEIIFSDDVKSFTIYSDDTSNDFYFFVDDIYIQRAVLLPEQGVLRLRYSSQQMVTFRTIEWNSTEPSGTSVLIEARAANNSLLLNRASFVEIGASSDTLDFQGTDIEIQITLFSDIDRVLAPILSMLRIMVISDSEVDGYYIHEYDELSRGTTDNVTIHESPVYVSLTTPINVESYFYAVDNSTQQVVEETTSTGNTYPQSELAVFGTNTPIAPNLVFKHKEDEKQSQLRMAKFFEPRSVRRLTNRALLIADTYNDRVLEMNEEGELLGGFGSINYSHSTKVFPIASCFDTRSNILYVVWSKTISFVQVNVSLITVQTATQYVKLYTGYDKIMGLDTDDLEQVSPQGQIMPIHLSSQNSSQVASMEGTDVFCFFSNLVLPEGFDMDSEFYGSIFSGQGIPCFVGPFMYLDGVFSPTWADRMEDGTTVVCNGTLAVKDYSFPDSFTESIAFNGGVSDVVLVDKNNVLTALPEVVKFSPFVPGRADPIGNNLLLMGGFRSGSEISTIPEGFNFRTISGSQTERKTQREILAEMFSGLQSDMVVFDTSSEAITFRYTAPEHMFISDVDLTDAGNYMAAESSFSTTSGRIVTVDTYGNIIFSYGEGLYSVINDIAVQYDGSVVIST